MVLLISYDLNGRERPSSYTAVRRVIEGNARSFKKPLYSQWLVETSRPIAWWQSTLVEVIDPDDRLFICAARWSECDGWLSQDVWDWLRPRAR